MNVHGLETIAAEITQPSYLVKCLLSEAAVAYFPASTQHADVRIAGMRYADESQGQCARRHDHPKEIRDPAAFEILTGTGCRDCHQAAREG